MPGGRLTPGLHEALLTAHLQALVDELPTGLLEADLGALENAEAADRVSRHLASVVVRAIEAAPENERSAAAGRIAMELLRQLDALTNGGLKIQLDELVEPTHVLRAVLRLLPDGRSERIERPLTPLLDTTVLTNAPGEPAVGYELRAEIPSADAIDAVVAFIRWSGVRPLLDALRRHCDAGKQVRILTTTYTNSTEQRALDELEKLGAQIRVSYDASSTRLHAKAWLFQRQSGYSTAYIGSSNLSHSAQIAGLEWNVRLSAIRNPDAVAKIEAVFNSYWESRDFVVYNAAEFAERTKVDPAGAATFLSPIEIELRPFQEALLEHIALARHQGHHRNLLVAATGTGKTVVAAVDYARLRQELVRDRLLFVAHREEILNQSLAIFRQAVRDGSFGEKWVGGSRPARFEHVFASIQSLNASDVERLDPAHFDMVIVDEFHHAAAPSYRALLERLEPRELLGLTATPERADGLNVLEHFDGRIAAELRLWDAIDQQHLAPFAYFGIHDNVDLREIAWRRGQGYDIEELSRVLTGDHAWVHLVLAEIGRKVADPLQMRALGFCVSVAHAQFMASRFTELGLPSVAVSATTRREDRAQALRDLSTGSVKVVFAVDLFNEGVDIPNVDTLLLLRPTDSPTLFLQQLGRGLRKSHGKTVCTVLDFVGTHRKEFRFDRRLRALLGGSRLDVEREVKADFPFLPAGCSFQLDPVAKEIVLRSIRQAIPATWLERVRELRSLGDVGLAEYLEATGLELDDVYSGNHSWSELRREAGLGTQAAGPDEAALLRAVGRLLHVDDDERLNGYSRFLSLGVEPTPGALSPREQRLLRMLVASLTSLNAASSFDEAIGQIWAHPEVCAELLELLAILRERVSFVDWPLGLHAPVPISVHARYTRLEILAGFGVGSGAKPATWQTGVQWAGEAKADLFAFTFDKSVGGFSPTTRYRDYAVSPDLMHWESQSATAVDSKTGQRYIRHQERGTAIVLFARMRTTDRAFWCLGPASYVSHEGDRPIAFVWRLHRPLPAELYTSFAAAAV